MAMAGQEFHAKAVDRSKERAVECRQNVWRNVLFENAPPGALLHLVRGAIGECDYDQAWKPIACAFGIVSDLGDAFGDCRGLAGPSRGDHREVFVQLVGESFALSLIFWRSFHSSDSIPANAG